MRYQQGFSLIEMSVVLAVVGLLLGGILVGKDIARGAQVTATYGEATSLQNALSTFMEIYGSIPGDMIDATNQWGSTGASCETTESTTFATCDGNGDGRIYAGEAGTFYEVFAAFKHLSNAELIQGRYTGVSSPASTADSDNAVIGTNIPASKLSGGGFYFMWPGGGAGYFSTPLYHILHLGAQVGTSPPRAGLLSPEEALKLDTKYDDGKPGMGNITVRTSMDCADSNDREDAVYDVADNSDRRNCVIHFRTGL